MSREQVNPIGPLRLRTANPTEPAPEVAAVGVWWGGGVTSSLSSDDTHAALLLIHTDWCEAQGHRILVDPAPQLLLRHAGCEWDPLRGLEGQQKEDPPQ